MSSPRRLTRGVYVGDVTALCALPPTGDDADAADPASDGARPRAHDTLLAGTGASLKWYDPFRAGGDVPLLSTTVFPSARVHGILPSPDLDAFVASASGASGGRAILVWGERRVAVATLRAGAGVAPDARELRVTRALPPLGHWVHDARPMRPDAHALAETTVAVGLADNAVEQWSLGGADAFSAASSPPALLRRVECSHRSMLYSLALRGSRMADLRVAGGTIFNEVQLWAPGAADAAVSRKTEGASEATSGDGVRRPPPFAILRGHEGSIMRVSWSRDGTRVFSTSDDRTARTWRVTDRDADRGGDPGGRRRRPRRLGRKYARAPTPCCTGTAAASGIASRRAPGSAVCWSPRARTARFGCGRTRPTSLPYGRRRRSALSELRRKKNKKARRRTPWLCSAGTEAAACGGA